VFCRLLNQAQHIPPGKPSGFRRSGRRHNGRIKDVEIDRDVKIPAKIVANGLPPTLRFSQNEIGGMAPHIAFGNEFSLFNAHAADSRLDKGADFGNAASHAGMAVGCSLVFIPQIRMGIQLKNGYVRINFFHCLNGPKGDAVLPADHDRNLPISRNEGNGFTNGVHHLSRTPRVHLDKRQRVNTATVRFFQQPLIKELHVAGGFQDRRRTAASP